MIDTIFFFHGWGYHAAFWQKYIQDYNNTNILLYNRGYYDAYHKPPLATKGKNRCITHSTGLFFAVQDYGLTCFDDIIIYAGFDCFLNKISSKAMRLGLERNPTKILDDFYHTCGFRPTITEQPNIKLLADDLKMLETLDISQELQDIHYTAYHGQNDPIILTPLKGATIIANTGHLCNLT